MCLTFGGVFRLLTSVHRQKDRERLRPTTVATVVGGDSLLKVKVSTMIQKVILMRFALSREV